ncbi:hypothetical protein EMIT0324P_170036 [Pseudomonas chlororaphis]
MTRPSHLLGKCFIIKAPFVIYWRTLSIHIMAGKASATNDDICSMGVVESRGTISQRMTVCTLPTDKVPINLVPQGSR